MTPDETRAALQAAMDAIDQKEAENAALNLELARAQAAQRDAEAQAADEAAARDALQAAHDAALTKIAANEESRRIPATVPAAPAPAALRIVPPTAPAAPSKPSAPLGRNGRPILSRHYLGFLLAALLGLSLMGCAGTPSGDALDHLAGIKVTVDPNGTRHYEKLPTSPIQDAGSLFGPIGVLVGGLVAGGIYGVRQLSNSVPAKSHDALIAQNADPVSTITTTHTGPVADLPALNLPSNPSSDTVPVIVGGKLV